MAKVFGKKGSISFGGRFGKKGGRNGANMMGRKGGFGNGNRLAVVNPVALGGPVMPGRRAGGMVMGRR